MKKIKYASLPVLLMFGLSIGCFAQPMRITLNIQQSSMDSCLLNNIGTNTLNQLGVFPNPNDGQFTIFFGEAEVDSKVLIQVISLAGEILKSYEEFSQNTNYQKKLELNTFPCGIYVIKVNCEGFSAKIKVVIL